MRRIGIAKPWIRAAGGPRIIALVGLLVGTSLAASPSRAVPALVPSAPALAAGAYLLQDFHSGRVLAESNADQRMEPASLTKIMTAFVAFREITRGNIRLDDEVLVSEKAWKMPGSRMFIEVGTRVTVQDLLRGVIVQSGNDASVALAEHIAGSESVFAQLMNQYAAELGLTGSNFVNAEGLPHEEHYTTARDMARLTAILIHRYPELYRWHAEREFTYNGISQNNRNRLLWQDESVDGVKTGYTSSAGYCLVASAERDGMRLVSVVLGSKSSGTRLRESQTLLAFGFRFYETRRLFAAGETVSSTRVWEGERRTLGLGLAEDLYVTVPRGQYKSLATAVEVPPRLLAPVQRGERQGAVRVTLGDSAVAQRDLIALQAVEEGSLWQRLSDKVRLWFE